MKNSVELKTSVVINGMDVDVTVKGEHYPKQKGVWTLPNGDPGYPDEPAYTAIESVVNNLTLVDIKNSLNHSQIDYIEEQIISEFEYVNGIAD